MVENLLWRHLKKFYNYLGSPGFTMNDFKFSKRIISSTQRIINGMNHVYYALILTQQFCPNKQFITPTLAVSLVAFVFSSDVLFRFITRSLISTKVYHLFRELFSDLTQLEFTTSRIFLYKRNAHCYTLILEIVRFQYSPYSICLISAKIRLPAPI